MTMEWPRQNDTNKNHWKVFVCNFVKRIQLTFALAKSEHWPIGGTNHFHVAHKSKTSSFCSIVVLTNWRQAWNVTNLLSSSIFLFRPGENVIRTVSDLRPTFLVYSCLHISEYFIGDVNSQSQNPQIKRPQRISRFTHNSFRWNTMHLTVCDDLLNFCESLQDNSWCCQQCLDERTKAKTKLYYFLSLWFRFVWRKFSKKKIGWCEICSTCCTEMPYYYYLLSICICTM